MLISTTVCEIKVLLSFKGIFSMQVAQEGMGDRTSFPSSKTILIIYMLIDNEELDMTTSEEARVFEKDYGIHYEPHVHILVDSHCN